MEKYHKTDIAPVEQENERDENYRASNPQIDCRRTGGNYHIVKRQRSYTQFINDKIAALDLPAKVRKDAVLMCSFVVGLGRRVLQEFITTRAREVLCRMHPLLFYLIRQVAPKIINLEQRHEGACGISASPLVFYLIPFNLFLILP